MSPSRRRKLEVAVLRALHLEFANEVNATIVGSFRGSSPTIRVGCGLPHVGYYPDGVSVGISEILTKADERVDLGWGHYKPAAWQRTGKYRLVTDGTVTGRRAPSMPPRSYFELKNLDFNYTALATEVGRQWRVINAFAQARDIVTGLRDQTGRVADMLRTEFDLLGVEVREDEGPRNELMSDQWGLTLHFHKKLTATEARALLQTAKELGLLPGGVRKGAEMETKPLKKIRSRFERIR